MGYWGAGIFDNDSSRELLNEYMSIYVRRINALIQSEKTLSWQELEFEELCVCFEVFCVLASSELPIELYPESKFLETELENFTARWIALYKSDQFPMARLESLTIIWKKVIVISREHES